MSELVGHSGRVFERRFKPGIADANAAGRVRLDAIARWLQDIAYLDLLDAGLEQEGVWIVRRVRLSVRSFPRFGDDLALQTSCTGIGRFSAERTTTVGGGSAAVEAVALWVWLDSATLRPRRFPPRFGEVYAESAAGRDAKVRLGHPAPPADAVRRPWAFRATDVDVAAHVNNSHYWSAVEEELGGRPEPDSFRGEIEHPEPSQPGEHEILAAGQMRWIARSDGVISASIRLA